MSYRRSLSSTRSTSPSSDEQQQIDESQPMIPEKDLEEDAVTSKKRARRSSQSIFPWIPHLLLLATYCGVILTWPKFRPHLRGVGCASLANGTVEHWEAMFLGTSAEIGDYFNVSITTNPAPGAQAAWQRVQEADQIESIQRKNANHVRINRAYIASPKAGDSQVLTHIHRLHCLQLLWKRWHGQLTEEEVLSGVADEVHDGHCFEILRYALMCDSSLTIKKVGWTGTKDIREGWIDVAAFCHDPELEGVEIGDKNNGSDKGV